MTTTATGTIRVHHQQMKPVGSQKRLFMTHVQLVGAFLMVVLREFGQKQGVRSYHPKSNMIIPKRASIFQVRLALIL